MKIEPDLIDGGAEGFVKVSEIALRYGVAKPTVLKWIRQGLFPAVKQGKVIRVRLGDVVKALEGDPSAR